MRGPSVPPPACRPNQGKKNSELPPHPRQLPTLGRITIPCPRPGRYASVPRLQCAYSRRCDVKLPLSTTFPIAGQGSHARSLLAFALAGAAPWIPAPARPGVLGGREGMPVCGSIREGNLQTVVSPRDPRGGKHRPGDRCVRAARHVHGERYPNQSAHSTLGTNSNRRDPDEEHQAGTSVTTVAPVRCILGTDKKHQGDH